METFFKIRALSVLSMLTIISSSFNTFAQEKPKAVMMSKTHQQAISKITANPKVKKAMQTIIDLEPETMSNLVLLTEIPAPPYKEDKRAAKFAEMIKALGVDSIWTDTAGNVIALRKGQSGKKRIILEAHMDTVFPEGTDVKVVKRGDTLYAPGIADDTRGLTSLLTLLKVMNQSNIKTEADVLFVGTTGEEGQGDLRGVKNLFSAAGPGKIDSYIGLDGTAIGVIIHRGLGSHRYRITFKGPGGHSFGAFGLANPHNALGRAIHYWVVEADKFALQSGVPVTYNVAVTGGGTSVNSIPFESWMEVDMRSESPERLTGIDQLLQVAVKKALAEENAMKKMGKDLTVEVKMIGNRPSGSNDPSLPLVQHAMASMKYLGAEPELKGSSTNANIPISKGVPAITIGSGGKSGNAHALNEWFVNDKGYLGIQQALLILLTEAGIAK
jgi:acetylornithine deacetylase/succinyl-diaminopimelate desuccinylase-like protein